MHFRILLLLLAFSIKSYSQEQQLQDFIEQLAHTEQRNLVDLVESYREYQKHPLNLNNNKLNEFYEFPFFTSYQLAKLLEYKKQLNGFVDVVELRVLHVFTESEMLFLFQVLTVKIEYQKECYSSFKMEQIIRYSQVKEIQNGYLDKLKGSKPAIYFRNKQRWDERLRFGLTIQKDPGEYLYNPAYTQGFDFISVSLHYKPKQRIFQEVIIGDYSINLGQGLTIWNGFSMGKGVSSTRSDKNSIILRPYHSSDEIHFMRGVSIKLSQNNISFVPFFSYKQVDATIQKDSTINSLRVNGLHRTVNEIAQKGIIDECIIGGNLTYKKGNKHFGAQIISLNYSEPFIYQSLYQNQLTSGKQILLSSFDHSVIGKNWQLYGELAMNQQGEIALIEGINLYPTPNITLNSTIRNYSAGYRSIYANSFGERNNANNEVGFYNGATINLGHGTSIKSYLDIYSFPSFSYNENHPINGLDFFTEIRKKISSNTSIYLRFKKEKRSIQLKGNTNKEINRLRLHYKKTIGILTLQSRIEGSVYNKSDKGYLVFQDLKTQLRRLTVTTRFAYFHTPNFQSTIYAYQPNVLYAFRSMAYYNQGYQLIAMSKIHLSHQLKLWIKIQRITYTNKKTVSSGYYETEKPHLTSITFQLQLLL